MDWLKEQLRNCFYVVAFMAFIAGILLIAYLSRNHRPLAIIAAIIETVCVFFSVYRIGVYFADKKSSRKETEKSKDTVIAIAAIASVVFGIIVRNIIWGVA